MAAITWSTLILRTMAWVAVLAIIILSILPGDLRPRTGAGGRFEHILAYAGTALLMGLAYSRMKAVKIIGGLVGLASVLEFAQTYIPGRIGTAVDVLSGVAGGLVGLALGRFTRLWRLVPFMSKARRRH